MTAHRLRWHDRRPANVTASYPRDTGGTTTAASAADQLRGFATRVRRLGLNGRFDPESAFIERDDLAHALGRLATDLERLAADRPSRATAAPAGAHPVSPPRLAAALAARTREVARLRALLARAVRPGHRRRPTVSATQLLLPLTGDHR